MGVAARKTVRLTALALLLTAQGCATSAAPSGAAPEGLVGTWRGTASMLSAPNQFLEADATLRIARDGTYRFVCAKNSGGDNVARLFEDSGTVVVRGRQVGLRGDSGMELTLWRRGDTLSAVFKEIMTGRTVMLKVERVGPAPAAREGSGVRARSSVVLSPRHGSA